MVQLELYFQLNKKDKSFNKTFIIHSVRHMVRLSIHNFNECEGYGCN